MSISLSSRFTLELASLRDRGEQVRLWAFDTGLVRYSTEPILLGSMEFFILRNSRCWKRWFQLSARGYRRKGRKRIKWRYRFQVNKARLPRGRGRLGSSQSIFLLVQLLTGLFPVRNRTPLATESAFDLSPGRVGAPSFPRTADCVAVTESPILTSTYTSTPLSEPLLTASSLGADFGAESLPAT
ncbi:hypothetical protein B296_00012007 [Ensete ventricosum]|uniref:Uncharacterized protein n=1 Tax=Ensete ventricosum TaxID=4639 RepID=A0A426X3L6_ENSVE|nr:hypothetical protein B296_00012007 [Ensete ventricosum]